MRSRANLTRTPSSSPAKTDGIDTKPAITPHHLRLEETTCFLGAATCCCRIRDLGPLQANHGGWEPLGGYPSSCSQNITPYCPIQPLYNPYIGGICWYISRVLSQGNPTFSFVHMYIEYVDIYVYCISYYDILLFFGLNS